MGEGAVRRHRVGQNAALVPVPALLLHEPLAQLRVL